MDVVKKKKKMFENRTGLTRANDKIHPLSATAYRRRAMIKIVVV